MTHELQDRERWGVSEIEERSEQLAEIATKVWDLELLSALATVAYSARTNALSDARSIAPICSNHSMPDNAVSS
ncbi:hypothetical protein, partial [Halorubrum sp. Atlit-26R]|uniref:hypothetical protein n=1 Tax=Halorubrum sp. Atlit-26R TaxID=2282128 RepID=UPI001F386698